MNTRQLTAIIGTTATALLIGTAANDYSDGITSSSEGVRTVPYQDIGGRWTVCRGQTGVQMRVYTIGECDELLAATLAVNAKHVETVTPGFASLTPNVKAATVDFTYNVGAGNYDKSTLRKLLIAGDIGAACGQFVRYKYAAGKDCSIRSNNCYGVWLRRQAEQSMCLGEMK